MSSSQPEPVKGEAVSKYQTFCFNPCKVKNCNFIISERSCGLFLDILFMYELPI